MKRSKFILDASGFPSRLGCNLAPRYDQSSDSEKIQVGEAPPMTRVRCFEGCFPTHQQAERLAARLGVNCVRMHHMDNFPIWGDSPNKLTIDPRKLERLDYLIDQLKKRGVYTNLNLHVSRWLGEEEGFPGRSQAVGSTRLDWATITMTVIEGQGFDGPGRILIAATGTGSEQGSPASDSRRETLHPGRSLGRGTCLLRGNRGGDRTPGGRGSGHSGSPRHGRQPAVVRPADRSRRPGGHRHRPRIQYPLVRSGTPLNPRLE